MNREKRTLLAEETVKIVEQGYYVTSSGKRIDIRDIVQSCLDVTELLRPTDLERLRESALASPSPGYATIFQVVNETTLMGIHRLVLDGVGLLAALNFASAKNPGGGFLGGSQAQEESLARSSALYASLCQHRSFYEFHRKQGSLLYSHSMILSPNCPIFRDDQGNLLETPELVTFITSPAPNAGAIESNAPELSNKIPETLRQRADYLLALALSRGYRNLVLGAWGCGVFRNDPQQVADIFGELLRRGCYQGRFERILFSILDYSEKQVIINPFKNAFASPASGAE